MKYVEGVESTFTHNGKTATVDSLIDISREKPIKSIPVDKFIWLLDYCSPNEQRIDIANLDYPIIFTNDETYGYCILDGFHRFNKALRLNHTHINAIEITNSQLDTLKWKP